jgi:hypothetical protein
MSLLVSTGCGNSSPVGRRLGNAKEEAETWLERQEDKARQQADKAARDIEDFFGGVTGEEDGGGAACAATPLALSSAALCLVLSKKRTTRPGRD